MASFLRCCFFQSKLHLLRRSIKVPFIENGATFQSRNFLSFARNFKKQDNEDVKTIPQDKDTFSYDQKGTNVHHIDQKLKDALYGRGEKWETKGGSNPLNSPLGNEEYFKQAWQRKLDSMTQDKLTRDVSEKVPSFKKKTIEEEGPTSGSLQGRVDGDNVLSKKLDQRTPNQRIAEEFPDDRDEERDWRKNIPLTRYGRLGRNAYYYTKKMTRLGKQGKVKEAIQVFDDWMMVQDRVMPSKRTFITLIGIVGRAGYTRKAFQLFRQMKHLGLDPPDHVFTSLFNACANCPMPHYGLKHADSLYQQMKVKEISPSPITTMAAMKAFAMCGDFARAFQILDERRVPLDTQCLNTLLLACAADKQSGFRTALKVWQTMRENKVTPSQNSYNLLVRCVRDCGVGDVNTLAEDFGLFGQDQEPKEEITPFNFFATREHDTALLLSGQELCEEKEIVMEEESYKHESGTTSIENLPEIKPVSVTKLPPSHSAHVSEESLGILENLSVSDLRELVNNKEVIQDIMSPACNDEKTVHNKVIDSISSVKKEWWEDSESQGSLLSNIKGNKDPLQFFPHEKNLNYESDNPKTQLAMIANEYKSNDSALVTSTVIPADLNTKPGRLALIGGMRSLVSHMLLHETQPDLATFTQILSCVPDDAENEAMVLRMMEIVGVDPDIDFLNDVMMRRNKRHQSHTVKEVVVLVSKLRLTPNMRTYAAIALTCHRQRDALDLLEDMEAACIEPSIVIMSHLIYISRSDFRYKRFLLQKVEELALQPTPRIISMIEKSIASAKHNIVKAEKMADISDSRYLTADFQREFKYFLQFYQSWLRRTELRQEKHPWERFSETTTKKDKKLGNTKMSN